MKFPLGPPLYESRRHADETEVTVGQAARECHAVGTVDTSTVADDILED